MSGEAKLLRLSSKGIDVPALQLPLTLDASRVQVRVVSGTEGPLAVVGKAPVLEASDVQLRIAGNPDAPETLQIRAEIGARGLRVISEEFSDADRRKVIDQVEHKVLEAERYPTIVFESTRCDFLQGGLLVSGSLEIRGKRCPLQIPFKVLSSGVLEGEAHLRQTDFGIVPISSFLGALRATDEVVIRLSARFSSLG